MANTYYDSDLTGEQIEQALEAIDGVIVPANNGKVLAINNGKIEARSVQWDADLGPKSITENGTYNPASDNLDGYSQVTVNVSGGGGTTDANHVTYDSSVTYDSGTVGAALSEQRNTINQLDQKAVKYKRMQVTTDNNGNVAYTTIEIEPAKVVSISYRDTIDGGLTACFLGFTSFKFVKMTDSGTLTSVPNKAFTINIAYYD